MNWKLSALTKRERKEFLKKNKDVYNTHHIINRSCRDIFNNIEDDDNKIKINVNKHSAWHWFHWNEHPLETFRNLSWINNVMSDKAIELYNALCSLTPTEFYKDKFTKWKTY